MNLNFLLENSSSFSLFNDYIDREQRSIWATNIPPFNSYFPDECSDEPIHPRGELFKADCRYLLQVFAAEKSSWNLAKVIGSVVVIPFGIIVDAFRCIDFRLISPRDYLISLIRVPDRLVMTIFKGAILALETAHKAFSTISSVAGALIWHGGEALVRKIQSLTSEEVKERNTILSDSIKIRKIVYESIGITVLAIPMLFVPILAIQLIALPILAGSLYGTVNNMFTNRECPEYYTMGHFFDGEHTRGHAIKSMNPNLKAIVTGCYATTMVTRIAGYVLAVVGAVPFAAATVPLSVTVAMVAIPIILGLGTASFASWKARASRLELVREIEEFAEMVGVNLDDNLRKEVSISDLWYNHLTQRHSELMKNRCSVGNDLDPEWRTKSSKIRVKIDRVFLSEHKYNGVPLDYQAGWHANNIRNTTGYLTAAVGTLAAVVAQICLRVFVYA